MNTQPSAFPHQPINSAFSSVSLNADGDPGMTLRDWFASQALSGLLATDLSFRVYDVARTAYALADAMLDAREGR